MGLCPLGLPFIPNSSQPALPSLTSKLICSTACILQCCRLTPPYVKARSKTPGSDDLPVEFFVKFWDMLGADLVEVFNSSYQDGFLPSSSCKGIITLLFKKGDRVECKNWHPITLLNVDYKLCARTLAGRLLKVIHHMVHSDQTWVLDLLSSAGFASYTRGRVALFSSTVIPLLSSTPLVG